MRSSVLTNSKDTPFDSAVYLANAGPCRTIVELKPQQTFFCQGDAADSVFYLQKGRARVTVVSQNGKEATITLLAMEFLKIAVSRRNSCWAKKLSNWHEGNLTRFRIVRCHGRKLNEQKKSH
jgi:hypothetical protein